MGTIQETTEELRLPPPFEEKNITLVRRHGDLRFGILSTLSVVLLDAAPVDRL
jgi:hypothetical protein